MRWDFILSIVIVIIAMFLTSGVISHYAGDVYWDAKQAGIGAGILHGIIAPVMLVYALFSDFGIYEINNKEWFYDFGFILGFLLTWTVWKSTKEIEYYLNKRKEKKEDIKDIEKVAEKVVSKKIKEHEEDEKEQVQEEQVQKEKQKKRIRKPASRKTKSKEEVTI